MQITLLQITQFFAVQTPEEVGNQDGHWPTQIPRDTSINTLVQYALLLNIRKSLMLFETENGIVPVTR